MKAHHNRTDSPRSASPLTCFAKQSALLFAVFALPAALHAQTYTLTNMWSNTPASSCRSIAYSAVSNQVFVASTSPSITVLDGTAGTTIGTVGTSWLTASNGTFKLDQIAVADDGVLYGCTLETTVATNNPIKIFRWGSWNDTNQIVSYLGDPLTGTSLDNSSKRIGDTMTVQGSGTNTVILCGIGAVNSFVLFSTLDGTNFTPTVLTVSSGLVAGAGNIFGISFYTNNTFLLKPESSQSGPNLYLIQYPTNFASLTSPVAATVLATNTLPASSGSSYCVINYAPLGGLLAAQTNNSTHSSTVFLYSLTNFSAGATALTSASYSCATANGNLTESVAMGGTGKTNWIYGFDTANTLQAYQIIFTALPVLPSFTGPSSISGAFPPQTLSVNVTGGSNPMTNQWQLVTATATNNIVGANGTSYTITTPGTNSYDIIISNSAGAVTSSVVTVSLLTPVTNSVVSQLWSVTNNAPGYSFLQADDNTRGLAYDTNTGDLVIASHSGGVGLYIVNGTTGAFIGKLPTNGMNMSGTFGVDQVGVADDGAVYAGNLDNASENFVLTQWSSVSTNAPLYTSFGPADPGSPTTGDRWGDTLAVRRAGVNTQILIGDQGTPGTNVVLFTTSDGSNFFPNLIPVSGVPSQFAAKGVAFGSGNTFWAKSFEGDLYQISFDPVGLTASVLFNFTGSQFSTYVTAIGVDSASSPQILAGVDLGDQNNDLKLFQITGSSNAPVLFNQAFFPLNNANGNDNASVSIKYPRAYALDVNNGIIALTYGEPSATPAMITTPPTGVTAFTADPALGLSVGASGSLPLYYQWQFNSVSNLATATNISGAASSTYTQAFPTTNRTGWYDVIVSNLAGGQTSAPVLVTVQQGVTNVAVSNIYTLAGGSRPYLDTTTYYTRGIAYDTNTSTLVVADHGNTGLYVLNALTGADLGTLNTSGFETQQQTYTLDQVGFADDGTLYVGNLMAAIGDEYSLVQYAAPISVGAAANVQSYGPGDPGAAGGDSGDRWGDTMSVRGSGTNTQILLGSGSTTNVLLFTTADGQHFTPNVIPISGLSPTATAPSANGVAFGAGNTFWIKGSSYYDLRECSFDPVAFTATVIEDYSAGTPAPPLIPIVMAGLAVDPTNNILASICLDDLPNDLQFYLLSGTTNIPTLFDQAFFGSVNPNGNFDGTVSMKFPYAFGLNANNGIVAVKYSVPTLSLSPFSVTAARVGGTVVLSWPSVSGHNYNVLSSPTVTTARSTWTTNSTIAGTGSTLSYTNSSPSGITFYCIQGQ